MEVIFIKLIFCVDILLNGFILLKDFYELVFWKEFYTAFRLFLVC